MNFITLSTILYLHIISLVLCSMSTYLFSLCKFHITADNQLFINIKYASFHVFCSFCRSQVKNNCLFGLIIYYILLILWYLYFIFTHIIFYLIYVAFTLFYNSHFAHITICLMVYICEFHILHLGIYLDIYISILFEYFVKNSHPYSFS